MVYEIYPILLERWDIIPNVFLYFCGRDDNTFSLVASFPLTCCCQAKARNAPCTSRDMVTEKRLRKNLEPSIHHSCLMMKVETLNPTNGRKNLYLITTEELLSRSFQYWWKEHTHTPPSWAMTMVTSSLAIAELCTYGGKLSPSLQTSKSNGNLQ